MDFKEVTSTSEYQTLFNLIQAQEGHNLATSWAN
jgi:hypothetical protein